MAVTISGTNITLADGAVLTDPTYTTTQYSLSSVAFVTWDGTAASGSKANHFVSSITRSVTGVYIIGLTYTYASAPFCILGFAEGEGLTNSAAGSIESASTSSCTVNFEDLDGGYVNSPWITAVFYY